MATQAALIAGFSFAAVAGAFTDTSILGLTLGYFYYTLFTICLTVALFVLSQATIVVMFGPTMALKGSTDEAVKVAAGHMMTQQLLIFKLAVIAITALFFGSCILSWATYPPGIATITTVVYLVAYYFLVTYGYTAYFTFVPNEDGAFIEPSTGEFIGGSGEAGGSGYIMYYYASVFEAAVHVDIAMLCYYMHRILCALGSYYCV